jgi:hypothetical protein
MLGQGVLRECLLDPGVEWILSIGRSATRNTHPKLREIVHEDLWDYSGLESQLSRFDACFFCLGVSSNAVSNEQYERITYGITHAAASTLARLNPGMTFVFVSGAGADSSEQGRLFWARIKGKAENAVLRQPFAAAYVFRPGVVQPLHGVTSRTKIYRVLYVVASPLLPLLRRLFPGYILTTEHFGQAMLTVVRKGYPMRILESKDIHALMRSSEA